jgi:hypothetical protein
MKLIRTGTYIRYDTVIETKLNMIAEVEGIHKNEVIKLLIQKRFEELKDDKVEKQLKIAKLNNELEALNIREEELTETLHKKINELAKIK